MTDFLYICVELFRILDIAYENGFDENSPVLNEQGRGYIDIPPGLFVAYRAF